MHLGVVGRFALAILNSLGKWTFRGRYTVVIGNETRLADTAGWLERCAGALPIAGKMVAVGHFQTVVRKRPADALGKGGVEVGVAQADLHGCARQFDDIQVMVRAT